MQENNSEIKEWVTPKELAAMVGVTARTINHWLQINPGFIAEFCQTVGGGTLRPRYLIHKKGIAHFIANKSKTYKGNRYEKVLGPSSFDKAKENVAEMANEALIPSDDPIIAQAQQTILLRKAQLRTQQEVDGLKSQVLQIVQKQEQAQVDLLALPEAGTSARQLTTRAKIRQRIVTYAQAKKVDYKTCWNTLYRQLYYRYNFNASARAKHKGISLIDAVEAEGMLDDMFELACDLFRIS